MEENMKYMKEKVNTMLNEMVSELLIHKPDDPVPFMIDWVKKKYNRSGRMQFLSHI